MRSSIFFFSILLIFLLAFESLGFGQPPMGGRKIQQLNYRGFMMKYPRLEGGLNLSAANAMTDIAASTANQQAAVTDVYSRGFSPSAGLFMRYRFDQAIAIRANASALTLRGNDRWSPDLDVINRGKSYRNTIFEASALMELYYPKKNIRIKKDFSLNHLDYFLFFGISGFYHSPEVIGPIIDEFDRDLQNSENLYSSFQPAIPFGVGMQWSIANRFVLGIDFNFRYTFTDFLDGFTRQYSTRNDHFFTTGVSFGYIITSRSFRTRHSNVDHIFRGYN